MGFIASIQNKIKSTEKKTTGKKNKKKVLKFKTDLQCGGFVSKVQPHCANAEEVIRLVQGALDTEGYSAERMNWPFLET